MAKQAFAKAAAKDPVSILGSAPKSGMLDPVFGDSNFYTPISAAQEAYESLRAKQNQQSRPAVAP